MKNAGRASKVTIGNKENEEEAGDIYIHGGLHLGAPGNLMTCRIYGR